MCCGAPSIAELADVHLLTVVAATRLLGGSARFEQVGRRDVTELLAERGLVKIEQGIVSPTEKGLERFDLIKDRYQ